ncbi:MAG: FtsQ-type POTRA domain-containing protein [Oscillospiraceae bacterium]|jgi:cell division protein FtsQ|nr:FtsQ-type POTRA domain-containing protein [Oscillospiraceae bacterium]
MAPPNKTKGKKNSTQGAANAPKKSGSSSMARSGAAGHAGASKSGPARPSGERNGTGYAGSKPPERRSTTSGGKAPQKGGRPTGSSSSSKPSDRRKGSASPSNRPSAAPKAANSYSKYGKPTGAPASNKKRPNSTANQNKPQRNKAAAPPQNKAAHKHKHKRAAKSYVIYYVFFSLMLIAVLIALSLTVLFKITEIKTVGSTRYSSEEIINSSGIVKGSNLFLSNTKKAEADIVSQNPYIESVQVSRHFPALIKIKLTEAVPAAVYQLEERLLILSSKAKVLGQLEGELPENIPLVKGINLTQSEIGSKAVYENVTFEQLLNDLSVALAKYDLPVRCIDFTVLDNVKLNYQQRIIIELGFPDQLDDKINMAKYTIEHEVAEGEKGFLNVSISEHSFFRADLGDGKTDYSVSIVKSSQNP